MHRSSKDRRVVELPGAPVHRKQGGKSADEIPSPSVVSPLSQVPQNRIYASDSILDYVKCNNLDGLKNIINYSTQDEKNAALYLAASKGYFDIVQELFRKGAMIIPDKLYIIQSAVGSGDEKTLSLILDKVVVQDNQVLLEELEDAIDIANYKYNKIISLLNEKKNHTQSREVQEGGANITYKGRKYKIHIGKNGGRYILVGRNKTRIYV